MQKPPPDFRTNFEATHPPILIDNGLAILENDKIERHIMKSIPGGYNLFVQVCFKAEPDVLLRSFDQSTSEAKFESDYVDIFFNYTDSTSILAG